MLVVSTMRCMIRTLPTVVKLRSLNHELSASPGGSISCSFVLDRTPNFVGPMQIQLLDSLPGISAETVTIGADETDVNAEVHISPTIQHLSSVPLRFRAAGMMDQDVQVVSEATVLLILRDGEPAGESR